jgi:hypothetical protein
MATRVRVGVEWIKDICSLEIIQQGISMENMGGTEIKELIEK